MKELSEHLRSEALRLGFTLVGITSPDPPDHLQVYEAWLSEGRHGEMGYLESDRARRRRADPREILPECEAIVVLATNYSPELPSSDSVAAYALGDDYHDVLIERLRLLLSSLEGAAGREIKNRYYTDTGPLLERELAQRAGLGWIGKNTCLISPTHGSYFLLAELLIDLPLEQDEPMKIDHCGECRLCIEACPTDCILPDRTLDARRCISYLTIELKGVIPVDLRLKTGDWVFGCDICQQVCPWNIRFAVPTSDQAFQSRPFFQHAKQKEFLRLSTETYRREFKNSPLKRAKRSGLLRNAAVAAANSNDRSCIPGLVELLMEGDEPLARSHSAWALGQFGELDALRNAEARETDPAVAAEIESAIQTAEAL